MNTARASGQEEGQVVHDLAATYHIEVLKDKYWSVEELRLLQEAVTDLANAMGGAGEFTRNIGSITIRQVETKYRGLASKRGIKFTASSVSFDKWTVVHELGHVWDAKSGWRLSRTLQAYTGGRTNWLARLIKKWRRQCDEDCRWPGCNRFGYFYAGTPPAGSDRNFNRKEDFAESVTAYVYPTVAQSRVERFKDDDDYGDLLYYSDYMQTKRWAFVDGLVRSR
ncbi:MAG: hypothetical protein IMY86_11285 [Chloroflexi bacterium]|nr:hypothetical protein [Chloroflexota bacterium]